MTSTATQIRRAFSWVLKRDHNSLAGKSTLLATPGYLPSTYMPDGFAAADCEQSGSDRWQIACYCQDVVERNRVGAGPDEPLPAPGFQLW
jgi:hypothetical protein